MSNPIDNDFVQYCRQATDTQLENILKFEWDSFEHRDYPSAEKAAEERGWTVDKGVVLRNKD